MKNNPAIILSVIAIIISFISVIISWIFQREFNWALIAILLSNITILLSNIALLKKENNEEIEKNEK